MTPKNSNPIVYLALILGLFSCQAPKLASSTPAYETDIVCGVKINKTDAFTYRYEGKKYFFATYSCKESFRMNPKNFLEDKCAKKKE